MSLSGNCVSDENEQTFPLHCKCLTCYPMSVICYKPIFILLKFLWNHIWVDNFDFYFQGVLFRVISIASDIVILVLSSLVLNLVSINVKELNGNKTNHATYDTCQLKYIFPLKRHTACVDPAQHATHPLQNKKKQYV